METKEELFALMEQIAEEREAARPIVEKLATGGEPLDDIEIPEEWLTAGMVLELCEAADSRNESEPRISLSLSHLALLISTRIDSIHNVVGAYLQGQAWRENGLAHRFLCTYPPALQAFERARQAFAHHASLLAHERRAVISLADIYFWSREYDRSEVLIAAGRSLSAGDPRRLGRCDSLEGCIAFRRGDLDRARSKFEKALRRFERTNDRAAVGNVNNNLGVVYRMLGRTGDATEALQTALQIATELGLPSEINRAEWNLAQLALEAGKFNDGLITFLRVRADYLRRGMAEDAAEAGLCVLDALLALNRLVDAKTIAEEVFNEFARIQLPVGATTALAYLREIMQLTNDPQPAVRYVRNYIERLRYEPARLFVPSEN